jgi:hypothetical protein
MLIKDLSYENELEINPAHIFGHVRESSSKLTSTILFFLSKHETLFLFLKKSNHKYATIIKDQVICSGRRAKENIHAFSLCRAGNEAAQRKLNHKKEGYTYGKLNFGWKEIPGC